MKTTFFILIFFFNFSCHADNSAIITARASSELTAIFQILQKSTVLRSQFRQTRYLKILSSPIISEGKLNYFSGKGIIWEINKPIESKIIISQNKITEIDSNHKISSRPNPGVIYTLLDALFNGNSDVLRQNFNINHHVSTDHWRLELTPKSAPLNKIFKTIEINGQQQIKKITLNDVNSDFTIITLRSSNIKQQVMTASEEAYFAL